MPRCSAGPKNESYAPAEPARPGEPGSASAMHPLHSVPTQPQAVWQAAARTARVLSARV